jgi:hypothetical protein
VQDLNAVSPAAPNTVAVGAYWTSGAATAGFFGDFDVAAAGAVPWTFSLDEIEELSNVASHNGFGSAVVNDGYIQKFLTRRLHYAVTPATASTGKGIPLIGRGPGFALVGSSGLVA